MGSPRPSLLFGIPSASWDGKYYARYPRGDKPGNAGNLALGVSSYSVIEGRQATFTVSRTDGSSGAIAVDWTLSGISQGSPSPASGSITWADGETGSKSRIITVGLVTAGQSGTLTLSNARSTSGGATPVITGATATFAISNDTAAPTVAAIAASALSSSSIQITLVTPSTDAGSGLSSYTLQRATNSSFSANLVNVTGLANGSFPYSVTGLNASTRYYFRLVALDLAGNSSTSASANATTQASGDVAMTFDSGWTVGGGSFAPGQSYAFSRTAADLGTGPTVVGYISARGGSAGANVTSAGVVGTFEMTVGDGGGDQPTYAVGPDDDTWMQMLTVANSHVGDGTVRQANLNGLPNFDTFYVSMQLYTDAPTSFASYNEKSVWVTRNGNVSGAGHDLVLSQSFSVGSNSSGGTALYWGGTGSDNAGNYPPNDGRNVRNAQTFRSWGFRPHTTAAVNALYDAFMQTVVGSSRYQSSSTGLRTAWGSPGVDASWTQIYCVGYLQNRGATPPVSSYLVKDYLVQIGANAWKRFFLTNAPTLAGSTRMFDCRPISWSAGAVTIVLPYVGESDLSGWYLWYGNGTSYTRVGSAS